MDLLLVVPPGVPIDSPTVEEVSALLHDKVPAWTGNHAHIVVVARDGLTAAHREHDPIARSWLDDADTVLGTDVRDLLLSDAG